MEQRRVQYLDIIKTIAIFLVVFCHFVLLAPAVPDNIAMVACWSGVPMFFMVNGALLFTRPLNLKKHVRKTINIYLVLVCWRLIYLFALGAICHVPLSGFGKSQITLYLFAFGSLEGIGTGHLWFIEALLAVYILFPVLRICFDHAYGRKIILFIAVYGLLITNGLTGAQMLLDALAASGYMAPASLASLETLNPLGTYANMLGFFLLGAYIHTAPVPERFRSWEKPAALLMAAAGLLGMWAVKWHTSQDPAWDGILLVQGYRHLPVILLALGIYLLCRNISVKNRHISRIISATASRTLGVYYIHWIFGWLVVPYLALCFPAYNLATNILKTLILILLSLISTQIIEKIPLLKRLVTG